jgi:hypothetical protein
MNSVNADIFSHIVKLERERLSMREAILELLAEWDSKHKREDHRTGYTLDTYGIQLARQAVKPQNEADI